MNVLETITFDWVEMLGLPIRAKLIPSKVWNDLDKCKNDPIALRNYVKKWRCKIEWRKRPPKSTSPYIYIGGEYDPDTEQSSIHIYINEVTYKTYKFDQKVWDKFKFRIIQTLQHELIHFSQYYRRDGNDTNYYLPYKKIGEKKDSEREYLSHFDEIQAYAHCVWLELKQYSNGKQVTEYCNMSNLKRRCPSGTLKYILKTFDFNDKNNLVIPKLFDQIGKWDRKYKINSTGNYKRKR